MVEKAEKCRIAALNQHASMTFEQKQEFCQKIKDGRANAVANGKHPGHFVKHSEEAKEKMRNSHKGLQVGKNNPFYGHKHTFENRKAKSIIMSGITEEEWKGFTKRRRFKERRNINWREFIFNRDNYTCQICGKRGCNLNSHHIKSWKNYPKLRFDTTNGISLCVECHNMTKGKEERFEQLFNKIIVDKNMESD